VTPELSVYEKIDEARWLLLQRREYLAHGVHALMQPHITEGIPTAGVAGNEFGGIEFYFNPTFIESLETEELAFVMAHEAMHVLADHIKVRKDNHMLYNICCDVLVNSWLKHASDFTLGPELEQMLWDAKKIEYPVDQLLNYVTAEDLYDELEPQAKRVEQLLQAYANAVMAGDMQQSEKGGGSSKSIGEMQGKNTTGKGSGKKNEGGSKPGDQLGDQPDKANSSGATPDEHANWGDVAENAGEQVRRELKNNGALSKATAAGKVPAGLARAFEEIEQDFSWESNLRRFIASKIKKIETWERPNRRLAVTFPKAILPGQKNKNEYIILVYADMSGSIGEEEVGRFVGILKKAPKEIHFDTYSFDTRIYKWEGWDKDIMPRGGGGTSFDAVVDHAQRVYKGKYDGVVVLTDGYDSEPSPKHPSLWMWISCAQLHSKASGAWVQMPAPKKRVRRRS
jgi:predicted metal-dependent peptidase